MSVAPLRPCAAPGCGELVARGRCAHHARQRDAQRGSAARRGYDARHRRWRLLVLAAHPVCQWAGCGRLATEADHIVPLSLGGTWALENGQGLCKPHHSTKTAREQRDPWLGLEQAKERT